MKENKKRILLITWIAGLSILFWSLSAISVWAIDDDVPWFAGQSALPNVMILFDNSDSMQDSPYKYKNGSPIRPSWQLRTGVVPTADVDPSCTQGAPCRSSWTDSNYLFKDDFGAIINTLPLPGQNPPNLPGLFSNRSTVTTTTTPPALPEYNGTNCVSGDDSKKCDNKIYDSTVNWSELTNGDVSKDALFNRAYKHWKIKITEKNTGAVQYRTIVGRDAAGGYWVVKNGDDSADNIEYNKGKVYTYELMVGLPGEVSEKPGSKTKVFDRNFNWNAVKTERDFNFMYNGKTLEITAGTNTSESSTIIGRNTEQGYWEVATAFTDPCDFTSRYQIKGDDAFMSGLDIKRASGGNHPASKMYQAKLALQNFLLSDKIQASYTNPDTGVVSTRYQINVGFATFMQAMLPLTRAKYYKKIAAESGQTYTWAAHFGYKYRYRYYHDPYVYNNYGCNNGQPPASIDFYYSGQNYTNKSVDDTIQRDWTASNCGIQQTLCYKVDEITCSPTDSLPNRARIHLVTDPDWGTTGSCGSDPDGRHAWGATEYGYHEIQAPAGDITCADNRPLVPPGDGWVESGDQCYEDCYYYPAGSWTDPDEVAYYTSTWSYTWGDLLETEDFISTDHSSYVERDPRREKNYLVTPGFSNNAEAGQWQLVPQAGIHNVCLGRNSDGTCSGTGDISYEEPADDSWFQYPGKNGDVKYPHGWSYKKTKLDPALSTSWAYRLRDHDSYIWPAQYFNDNDDRFVFRYYMYYSGASIWSDSMQRGVNNYYPALTGNDFSNYYGEDQGVFVNLPGYDLSTYNLGDDYDGSNAKRILNRINLAFQRQYNSTGYLHSMAPGNPQSIAPSHFTGETGNGTPLAATLRDAKKYFESYIAQDPLSLNGCRKNYVILLTDGTETTGEDPVQAAEDLYDIGVQVFVIGFGLGANEKATLNNIAAAGRPLDEDGYSATAYFATNADQLADILAEDIASVVTAGSFNRAKPGLPKAGGREKDGLVVYSSYFDYPGWRGHLEAYDVYKKPVYDSNGKVVHRAGEIKSESLHWSSGCGGTFPTFAIAGSPDAGCQMAENNSLPNSSNREIYTVNSGNRVPFDASNIAALKPGLLPNPGLDINENGTPYEDADAEAVIGFTHHPGYDAGKYAGSRTLVWPLADIYNSSPVYVGQPFERGCVGVDANNDGSIDKTLATEWNWDNQTGYCQYQEHTKNREGILYFGTNGGMIEAIATGSPEHTDDNGTPLNPADDIVTPKVDGGNELWGFVPEFVLPTLHQFKEGHRFTVDLNLMVADVDTSDGLAGALTDWKTILIAGQRKGGNNYIALDVTDPTDPVYLWSFTDTNLGNNLGDTWSRPTLARIEIDGTGTSVFIFGGGHSSDPDKGNRIYIIKASDGSLLKEIIVGSSSNKNVPSRIKTMRYLTNSHGEVIDYKTNEIDGTYGDGLGIDSDRRDFIEVGYFGDTDGSLWRLEGLNTDAGGGWDPSVVRLYKPDAAHNRPIFHMPVVVDRKIGKASDGTSACIKRFILTGTGSESTTDNPQAPTQLVDGSGNPLINYIFEIEEDTTGLAVDSEADLTWRLSLGKSFPRDKYGFLLTSTNSGRFQHGGQDILSAYIFLLSRAEFSASGSPWAIDSKGNLTYEDTSVTPTVTELVSLKGEFLFKDGAGALYENPNGGAAVSTNYKVVDFSEWLTNQAGDFYDSTDGTILIPQSDVDKYYHDTNGFWCDGNDPTTCTKYSVDSQYVKIVPSMGEKMLTEPESYGEKAYFMTYTPEGGCGSGKSFFYGITASGCGTTSPGGTGLLTDGPGTEDYTMTRKFRHHRQRKIALGTGIANFTLGGGTAYVGQGGKVTPLPVPIDATRLKYWKQD